MINVSEERLITLRDASKWLPGHPHLSTIHRWRLTGARGARLETVLIGGRRYTSVEALERFVAATTAVDDRSSADHAADARRIAEIRKVENELDEIGLK